MEKQRWKRRKKITEEKESEKRRCRQARENVKRLRNTMFFQ
jgi:hypothetical protein